MKTVKNFFALTSAAALLSVSGLAAAEEVSSTDFHVTIRIKPVCEVNVVSGGMPPAEGNTPSTGTDIDFGEYFSNHKTDVEAQSKAGGTEGFTVKCTQGIPYRIALHPGTDDNNAGSGNMNRLGNNAAGEKIAYTLYQDSARQQVWGNQDNVNTLSGTGKGFSKDTKYPVYGRVRGDQLDKPVGRYADRVTVSVLY